VRATDRSQTNVCAAHAVLACNGVVSEEYDVRPLAFEDTLALVGAGSWDVVLFADVLYQEGTAAPLAQAVAQLLRPGGTIIGTVGVRRTGSWEIFAEMRRQGFTVSELRVPETVRSSALHAADCLRRANRCDAAGSMGLDPADPARLECKILRWVRTGQTEQDMSEALCQEILHAARSEFPFSGQGAHDEWVPTE
jgi:SAM-dependent methyltransferase